MFPSSLLRRTCEASKISDGIADVLLICAECGCASDELGRGWAAFTGEDSDDIETNQRRNHVPGLRSP
jgi:hypothetical protein